MEETRKKEARKRIVACCPICGNALFKGAYSDIEIRCSKCRTDLKIKLNWSRVSGFSYRITCIEGTGTATPA